MSDIEKKITADYTAAMRSGATQRKDTLRLLRAALKSAEIEKRGHLAEKGLPPAPLTDEEEAAVLVKQAKQRRESIELFAQGGRQDLVDQEQAELVVIEEYLPRQMDAADIERIARDVIAGMGVSGAGALGQVMREIMPRVKGKADGKVVNEIVRKLLV